jgi:hypothetical protein
MFASKDGAYPCRTPFKGLALNTNIRLGYKGMQGQTL